MWTIVAAALLGEPSHGVKAHVVTEAAQEHAETTDVIITLALATESPTWVETELPVTLPPGAAVQALSIDTQWNTFVSRSEPVEIARAHFAAAHTLPLDALTGRPHDPALLEQTESGLVL